MTETKQFSILMLCWNFPPAVGGIEAVAQHLHHEWQRHCEVTVIARCGTTSLVPEMGVCRPGRPGLLRYLLHAARTGFREVRSRRPDVLVCAGIVDAPVAWVLSRVFTVPYVVLAHGSDIHRRGRLYQTVVRFLFRNATAVAANSVHTRRLLEQAGIVRERIRVIHPGVDPAPPPTIAVDVLRESYELGEGPVLLTAGRVIRRKGIGEFVEHVLPGLCRDIPDLRYVVVGDDATQSLAHRERLLARIEDLVHQLGLQEHVRFTGQVSGAELQAWYQLAMLFVLPVIPVPGDVEGFGMVLLEANVRGVPVVATRIGGVPDAVEDGVTGRLVDPEDWPALQTAVAGLLRDEPTRWAMGEAGRARALRDFAWPVIARRYMDLLRQVAQASERRSR